MLQSVRVIFTILCVITLNCLGCQHMSDVLTLTDVPQSSVIKIGLIQPSSHYVSFGRGVLLAQARLNAQGGVLGSRIEVIQRDNQTTPNSFPDTEKTIAIATDLVETDEVVALFGPIFSSISEQVGPAIQALARPTLLGSAGTHANVAGDFMFLCVITNAFQGKVIADFAMDSEEINAKTAATLHQAGDAFSRGHVDAFVERFVERGGKIVASEVYQRGDTHFDGQLQRISDATPNVILLSSFAPEVPLIIKQARDMDIQTPFIGGDTWEEPEKFFNTLQDNTPLEGIYQTTNFAPEMGGDTEFIEAYTTRFGTAPDGIAASGYDGLLLLANAMIQAKSTDPIKVRDALASTKAFVGATYISHYDDKRHPVKSLAILKLQNGTFHTYKIINP